MSSPPRSRPQEGSALARHPTLHEMGQKVIYRDQVDRALGDLYDNAVRRGGKLANPFREHSSEYVINMWKIYNHVVIGHKRQARLFNLVAYAVYIFFILWLIGHLPVPAVMLQHQEAVTDLLLGEEFDEETTHIYKSYYDVMTAEEMWQWAQGPLAAALLVDGAPDGKMDALVGTNWLLGPLRIRLERSADYSTEGTCNSTLARTFGSSMGNKLASRGIQCTGDFRSDDKATWGEDEFLDLSQPLATLGVCADACAPATSSNEACVGAGECVYTPAAANSAATCTPQGGITEDCPAWDGDPESCEGSQTCAFTKRSFIDTFPKWVETQRSGTCFKQDCSKAYCCSVDYCFDDREQQLESIQMTGEAEDHACSISTRSANLTRNPQESYKSTVKSDTTSSDNLWAKRRNFGDGGYHIDLPGDSDTLVPMLKALEELGFADQFARSIDFQFVLINPNNFTLTDETLFLNTIAPDFNTLVAVTVELNFRFSASGFLSKYDRIQAVQLKPFHFVLGTTTSDDDDNSLIFYLLFLVPTGMIVQELQEMSETGVGNYFRSGWNVFEIVYIGCVLSALRAIANYISAEELFLDFYEDEDKQDLYNDPLPLRSTYKEMNKMIGLAAFITVFKFLKYVAIFRSTTVLWSTIDKAKGQLFTYLVVMLIIMSSFALLCVMMWGYTSKTFHNIPSAVFSLVRLSSGESELDYQELKRGDASFTPIVFMGFVVFVAIIGMNLMIAIITDFYEEARDKQTSWIADRAWIQEAFSSSDQYEDYYRGKGLWNEPITESLTGVIGQAWNSLRGRWIVKPIPRGCGPRTWDRSAKTIAEKVQPKFDTQKYPFVLQRSSIVHIRYRVESHEHSVTEASSITDPKALVRESFDDRKGWKPMRSRDPTPIYPNSPEAFEDERTRTGVSPLPQAFSLWMCASKLAQYKGVRYLELLKDPSIKVEGKHGKESRKCISEMSVEELKVALNKLGEPVSSTTENTLLRIWEECDVDGNKYLSKDELKNAAPRLLNARLSETELNLLMGQMDKDKDKKISRDEFFGCLEKQDPQIFALVQLHKTELQDRLRDALFSAAQSQTGQNSAEKMSALDSLDFRPGDTIKLGTPTEGGIAGRMTLEFQKFLPVRRATKEDKVEVSCEINRAKEEYHDALLEGHRIGRCKKHGEELIQYHADDVDPDELPKLLRTQCVRCAQVVESDHKIAECEEVLQHLHEARGKLEGVERIMVFRVKNVDAWQKFRPMDASSDDAAGQLGQKLKEQCMKNVDAGQNVLPMDASSDVAAGQLELKEQRMTDGTQPNDSIDLQAILNVLVEVVAGAMKHHWRHGTMTNAELSAMTESARVEYAKTKGVEAKKIQEANHRDKVHAGMITASQSDSTETVAGSDELYQANFLTREVLKAEVDRDGNSRLRELNVEEWLKTPASDGTGRCYREVIEQQCRSVIKEMADLEKQQNEAKQKAAKAMESATNGQQSPRDKAVGFLDCSTGGQLRASRTNVAACTAEDTLQKLDEEGTISLRELVPNYETAHPRPSAVMNRVLKAVQRVEALNDHTPLLEVSEGTQFELKLPSGVQQNLLFRAMQDSVVGSARSVWDNFKASNICSKIFFFTHVLSAPLRFLFSQFYFHTKVEEDVEAYLRDKCLHVRGSMSSEVEGNLKLQMDTFMSGHNSIKLSDFIYQLQYYTFKSRRPSSTTRWYELRKARHILPYLRATTHHYLRQIACLRSSFTTLDMEIQDHYTHEDEERAMNYLLYKYSDFIDRRRGSVPGESYNSSGVLLQPTVLAVLDQEREDVTKTRAEEEEALKEDLKRMFKQEVQALAKGGGIDRSAEHVAQSQRTAQVLKESEDEIRRLRQQVKNLKETEAQLVTEIAQLKETREKPNEVEAASANSGSRDAAPTAAETAPPEEPHQVESAQERAESSDPGSAAEEETEDLMPPSGP